MAISFTSYIAFDSLSLMYVFFVYSKYIIYYVIIYLLSIMILST